MINIGSVEKGHKPRPRTSVTDGKFNTITIEPVAWDAAYCLLPLWKKASSDLCLRCAENTELSRIVVLFCKESFHILSGN
jgi:hypothetical protein